MDTPTAPSDLESFVAGQIVAFGDEIVTAIIAVVVIAAAIAIYTTIAPSLLAMVYKRTMK